jgi:general secretion pathway protein A
MYEAFFRMRRPPFDNAPDPEFLYLSPSHREAMAILHYSVESGAGLVSLSGETGLGKTTVVRAFLEELDHAANFPIVVYYPRLSFDDLLELMRDELGLPAVAEDSATLVRRIQKALIDRFARGQSCILIIDEAHRMPMATLERICLLANLETNTARLLQIILVSPPELDGRLGHDRWRAVNQRISVRGRLSPLDPADARAYVRFRLDRAETAVASDVFTSGAIAAIAELGHGVPREMNVLANMALLEGLAHQERPVGRATVLRSAELVRPPSEAAGAGRLPAGMAVAAAAVLAIGVGWVTVRALPTAPATPRPAVAVNDRPVQTLRTPINLAVATVVMPPRPTAAVSDAPVLRPRL